MLLSLQDRPYGHPSEQSPRDKERSAKAQADAKAAPRLTDPSDTPAYTLTLSPEALRLLGQSVH